MTAKAAIRSIHTGVRYEETDVTVQLATELRLKQPNGIPPRSIKWSQVDRYCRDMNSGNWHPHAAPIQVDEDGALINGNHRLEAVKKLGRPVRMVIAWNVPRAAIEGIDRGVTRSLIDIIRLGGEKNPKERGIVFTALCEMREGTPRPASYDEYKKFRDRNTAMLDSAVEWQLSAKREKLALPGFLSGCLLFLALTDSRLDPFAARVVSAVGEDTEVARQLSKRLRNASEEEGGGHGFRTTIADWCATASEAHITGRKWKTIIRRDAVAAKLEQARDEATALRRFRKAARAGWARDLLGG